jgi:hypothetical protein
VRNTQDGYSAKNIRMQGGSGDCNVASPVVPGRNVNEFMWRKSQMVGGPDDDGFTMAESKYQIHDGPRDCNLRKSRR